MWSASGPSPATVTWLVPSGVVAEVEMVSVEVPPDWTLAGLKVAFAPSGRPVACSATVWALPEVIRVVTVVVAVCPGWTDADAGESVSE